MTPAETLAKAKQLDGFLGNAVKEIKAMNKLEELALRSADIHKAVEKRADRFAARIDALPDLIERAFAPQEAKLDALERGAELLEASLHSMIGHNGGPLPESQEPLPPQPPVSEEPVAKVEEPAPMPAPEPVIPAEPTPLPALDPTATGNPPA